MSVGSGTLVFATSTESRLSRQVVCEGRVCLKAFAVVISGRGVPALTATPGGMPVRTYSSSKVGGPDLYQSLRTGWGGIQVHPRTHYSSPLTLRFCVS